MPSKSEEFTSQEMCIALTCVSFLGEMPTLLKLPVSPPPPPIKTSEHSVQPKQTLLFEINFAICKAVSCLL